ncbi:MAG: SpoIIE family protein phosphatase [Pirellulales bacterium]|nr:SpoIIE family protein phosphatase [Pirellulales bacterium]
MPYLLTVVEGPASPERCQLGDNEVVIGRERTCGVMIDFPAVSRRHARLVPDAEACWIEDLGSRNGTYVNGSRVDRRLKLKPGDRIVICETTFVLQSADASAEDSAIAHDGGSVVSSLDATSTLSVLRGSPAEARLEAMLRITQALGPTLEFQKVLGQMLDGLFDIFPAADRGLVLLRERERLIPRAMKLRRESSENVRYSRTIVEKALAQRQAILSEDARQDIGIPSESLISLPIRSVMCAPLLAQDSTALGVIQLDTDDPRRRFNANDLQILSTVAIQASMSIQFTQIHHERMRHAKLERELELAKQVQHSFLPVENPEIPGYRFWSHYQSANQVGGDFYDYLRLPGGHCAVLLGDVAGKGVPAALMMAKVSACCKLALLANPTDLCKTMAAVNAEVCGSQAGVRFVTLVVCILDPATHAITLASAGHMSPMVRRRDGSVEEPADLQVRGIPLGVMPEFAYTTTQIQLHPGECAVLYSDGLSEAMNSAGELYSTGRIRRHLESSETKEPADLAKSLLDDIRQHVAGSEQFDDMSLVIFGRVPE